ncbi:MAG: hypothetical protein U0232_20245 [Thermomicrobiales bacterium]
MRVELIATPRTLAARGLAQESALILVDITPESPADRAGRSPATSSWRSTGMRSDRATSPGG